MMNSTEDAITDSAFVDALQLAKIKVEPALERIIDSLSPNERISFLFLALSKDCLALSGYTLCQYSTAGRVKDISIHLWQGCNGNSDVLLSALYNICRYDLLQNVLKLCSIHTLHQVCKSLTSLDSDRVALYRVFASLTQLQTEQLLQTSSVQLWRLSGPNTPLEEIFCANLTPRNYSVLLSQLHAGLCQLHWHHLALLLKPYVTVRDPADDELTRADGTLVEVYERPKGYPHGLCVIINVNSFVRSADPENDVNLPTRRGSDIDTMRLEGTFKLFGFAILHMKDPDAFGISNFFANLHNDPKLACISCLAICFMTHGDSDDRLYLHDRSSIPLADLRRLCFTQLLINKPRLIFVQACRGNQLLRPLFIQRDYIEGDMGAIPINRESDCLVSSATVRGYSAIRSQSSGSWFISELCASLQLIGHLQPLHVVLQHSRRSLNARVDMLGDQPVMQINEDITTLQKEVRLVRGPESSFMEGIYLLVLLETLEELIDEAVDRYFNSLEEGSPQMIKIKQLLLIGY